MVQVNEKAVNVPSYTIRFRFRKVGKLQYISHLDLVRTMNKIIVRARLPLWYTEGFNPKPKMTFAAPLSVGTESECEFMDLRLTEKMDPAEAMRRINENMTDEMQVTACYYPTAKLTELAYLSYEIKIRTVGASAALADAICRTLSDDKLEIEKKTKSGEAIVDIRPLIHSAKAVYNEAENEIHLSCILSGDQTKFLNPELVLRALREKCGILSDPCIVNEYATILRTAAFRADMTPFV